MKRTNRLDAAPVAALFLIATLLFPACSKKDAAPAAPNGGTAAGESPEAMKARMKKEIDAKNAQQVADQLKKEIESDH